MKNTFDDLPEYLVPIEHSALGSTWAKKAHKYIAKIGNKYYYDARQLAAAGKQKVSTAIAKDKEKYAEFTKTSQLATKTGEKDTAKAHRQIANSTVTGKLKNANVARIKAKDAVNNTARKTSMKVSKAATSAKKSVSSVLNNLGVKAKNAVTSAKKSAKVAQLNVKNAKNRANTKANAKSYLKVAKAGTGGYVNSVGERSYSFEMDPTAVKNAKRDSIVKRRAKKWLR